MTLPVVIPNEFANATASIPLSQLDSNFSTLANVVNEINAGTQQLSNANVVTLIVTGNATIGDASSDTVTLNSTLTANTAVIFTAGTSAAPSITTTGDTNTGIFFPAADTIAFAEGGAEALRIDSSGNVGIGVTDPSTSTNNIRGLVLGGSNQAQLRLQSSNTGYTNTDGFLISINNASPSDGFVYNYENANIIFGTNNTERARITSGGYFKASNNGSYANSTSAYHEIYQSAADRTLYLTGASASLTADGIVIIDAARNTTNNTFYALSYYNTGAGNWKFRVADSGNVTNTNNSYGSLSDVKLKQDIVDAGSQWDDIKSLRVRKYRWKSDPDGFMQMGLVAQEAEEVSPGLVEEHPDYEEVTRTREVEKTRVVTEAVLDEDGNEIEPAVTETYTEEEEYTERVALDTTTKSVKYSVLYMKAVKALQEAMDRIETLEASNTALEARIAALENA